MRVFLFLFFCSNLGFAAIETLFTIGEDDGNHLPFASKSGRTEDAPGSADLVDDHYYLSQGEPVTQFENSLNFWDPRSVIYFDLTAEQANPDGVLEFTIDFIWSGMSGGGTPSNQISCYINDTEFFVTPAFQSHQGFQVTVNSSEVGLIAGTNTLEIVRTGVTINTWVGLDYLQLKLDSTANQDLDGDGLPLAWETLYQLSDENGDDAHENADDDQLTNLEEFLAGTNPRNPDSDEDGLVDHLEVNTDPLNPDTDDDGLLDGEETTSNPTLADSDGDGAFDAWEIRTGYNPSSSASTPPTFSGSIGINFQSSFDLERGNWSDKAPNGWVPQPHWNHTQNFQHWSSGVARTGDNTTIVSPSPGQIVDSSGTATTTQINFTYDGTWATATKGTIEAELLHSFLRSSDDFNTTITLSDIPYNNYDLYLYVAADFLGPQCTLRLNSDPASDQSLRPWATSPVLEFLPVTRNAGPSLPSYNTIRFSDLSGTSASIEIIEIEGLSGISAIQIVDREADSDNDGLPDYWELQHRTGATISNANADSDGDSLSNQNEFTRETDPNNSDSDHDGLSDFEETNLGTNPLDSDSDEDGISDADELALPFPSDPLLADTDNDGFSDLDELEQFSDPTSNAQALLPIPTFPSANSLLWRIEDVQLVQNHFTPVDTTSGTFRTLVSLNVTNAVQTGWRTFEFILLEQADRLGCYFASRGPGGFNHPVGYNYYRGDVSIDYRPALGLSGYGTHDISDPITFELSAVANPSPATDWTLTYRVINQSTNTTVFTHIITDAVPASSIVDQTATWRDQQEIADRSSQDFAPGVTVYRSSTPLETLPAFSAYVDQDNDGMPDEWETANSFNPNNANDATLDPDGDELTNLEEYLLGTSPHSADSDNDGVNDDEEFKLFSDPNSENSEPEFFQTLLSYNSDLDNNGLPDVWEAAYLTSGLVADQDSDGDGFTNAEEASAGTDPLNNNSAPFLKIEKLSSEQIRLTWSNIAGKSQSIQHSSGLSAWETLTSSTSLTAGNVSLNQDLSDESQFFQMLTRDQNTDGDALNDWTELALGYSPTTANSVSRALPFDSDNDGDADTTQDGDLVSYLETFSNYQELRSGGPVANPTRYDASRLLMQATFGPTMEDIEAVQELGMEAWIDDQIENQPPTYPSAYIDEISQDFNGPRTQIHTGYSFNEMSDFLNGSNFETAFARAAISGPDQLRQRVAFALSQILVISRRDTNLTNRPIAISSYYDLLLDHAFGNYEDLLLDVTFHPAMGRYLSHVGNQPPAPEINRFPDENYARELMQLFTIGLWELSPDGTRILDSNGQPIPTYSNEEITNFARVMTGFWYGGNPWASGGWQDQDYAIPMEMHEEHHDFDAKTLLNGASIPRRPISRENAILDVQDAIRNLFEHPNCAPFISRALIQFLITSNPTPEYVARISGVFDNDGSGQRGNLGAVVKAILMDPEARDPAVANHRNFGIFREPVIRTMHLARITRLNRDEDLLWWDYGNYNEASFQKPMLSPSVFNFYRPDYSAPGVLTQNGLSSPALEITNSYTAVSFPNTLWDHVNNGFTLFSSYSFPPDYSSLLPFASDHEALLDYLNLLVCSGQMNARSRSIILEALAAADPGDDPGRVRLALYLALMSPQGAVQR